jgi:hypothetical protein
MMPADCALDLGLSMVGAAAPAAIAAMRRGGPISSGSSWPCLRARVADRPAPQQPGPSLNTGGVGSPGSLSDRAYPHDRRR